ncbi:MAG TPA: ATP-binding protein [Stellaceae bacterium]|nr:ATP-binding protein [Stellaceae bacterium]
MEPVINALPAFAAGITAVIVAVVFARLWWRQRQIHLLAFGGSFAGRAVVMTSLGVLQATGSLPLQGVIADAGFIGSVVLLLAGCIALNGRPIPWRVLAGGGIATYLIARVGAGFGISGVTYIPELGALAYAWIAYLLLSQPALPGNRLLGYLFIARCAVNLPWIWAFQHGLTPFNHRADEIMITTIGAALILTDLSRARRQAETANAELHRSEQRLRDYAETASDWFWETGPTHRFTYMSERWTAFGIDRAALVGRRREELASDAEAEPEKWRDHLAVLDRHVPFRDFVFQARLGDGLTGYISTSGKPMIDAAGRFLGYRGVGSDVTAAVTIQRALREAKDVAEAASRAKSEFLANMSHELRTPLNAVIGMSEIISTEMFGPVANAQYLAYAADIHKSSLHLLGIINDLLDMAKIESGKGVLDKQNLALGDTVVDVVRVLETQATAAKLALEASIAVDLPRVWADERAIRSILFNLLSNALKFTPRGGRVTVVLSRTSAGHIEMVVADTGIGIAAEDIPRLMRPFAQLENVYQRKHQGTGLGLALARSLVELHGGSIGIESEPGQGTVVTVLLPAAHVLA